MDSKIAEQILDELAPTFEAVETQSAAIMQFLKDRGIASDEQLAPYMEQAAAASSVRWRALRVRMGRLLSMAENRADEKRAQQMDEGKAAKERQASAQGADANNQKPGGKQDRVPGSRKRGKAADQNAGAVRAAGEREGAESHQKEAAQKERTAAAGSEQARPREDEAADTGEEKDVA
jgi:hypothetical protein